MAAINPRLIEDTIHLIETYQQNGEGSAFRRRFDMAIARDVNATYKNRPLKLYFEILASINKAKFGESYKDIRRLVKHDNEGIIKKTLLQVSPKDLRDLAEHEKQAKKDINSTDYPPEEIDKINKIEEASKDRVQKREQHAKRLDQTEYFAVTKKTPAEIKEEEKAVPAITPEFKKPSTTVQEEVPKKVLVGPSGEPIRNIIQEQIAEQPEELAFEPRAPEPKAPSLPQAPDLGFAKRIIKTGGITETAGAEAGVRIAAGRAAAAGVARAGAVAAEGGAQAVARIGIGAAARTGASTLARIGFSAATGIATGGTGFVVMLAVSIANTFSGSLKRLFREVAIATIAVILLFVLMSINKEGMSRNVFLPPYQIGEAAGLPPITPTPSGTVTPTPTGVTPVPGAVVPCPVPGGRITCGPSRPSHTSYSNCNQGHCAGDYGFPSQCVYTGNFYAIDIPGSIGQSVLIPSITDPGTGQSYPLDCRYIGPVSGTVNPSQIITQFSCVDTITNTSYWIQFHHLQNNYAVPIGTKKVTGDSAGNIAADPDGFNHTHVQIGKNGGCGSNLNASGCVPADQYVQCGR